MARFIENPNQFGFIEWNERVESLDGDNLLVSVKLEGIDSSSGFNTVDEFLENISWMTYETEVEIFEDGVREVTVIIEVDPGELNIDEVYRFKAIADDGKEEATRTFELSVLEALKVLTEGTNSVGSTQVSLAGNLQTLGESTEADVTFQYREKGTQTWNFANFQETRNSGRYNIKVADLVGNGTYEFRAFALGNQLNQQDTGDVIEVNTGDSVKVSTTGSNNVLGTSADLTGKLESLGGSPATDVGFEYRKEIFASASFDRNVDLSEEDTSITDVYFKPDGEKMYVSGSGQVAIYEYNLSNVWDVTSASLVNSFSVSSEDPAPTGVYLKSNGNQLYVTGASNGKIFQYRLSSSWDISTASLKNTFDVNDNDSNPTGIAFGRKGRRLYFTGSSNDNVYEYGLPTPWEISTASFNNLLDISSEEQSPRGLTVGSEGIKLYTVGDVNSNVYEYDLSTQWDISTGTFNRAFDVSSQDSSPRGVRFHANRTSMYVVGRNNNSIFEYEIDGQYKKTSTQRLTSTGAFVEDLINLEPDTTYEFRAFANALGGESARGENQKLTTQPAVDLVTEPAEDLDTTSLTLVGTLNNLGGASNSDVYFEYREVGASSWISTPTQNLNSPGEFREGITNLSVNTSYEFRAIAETSDGDSAEGNTLTTTTHTEFSVTTNSPTEVGVNSVTFNATLDDLGGANTVDVYFEYRKVGESSWNFTPFQTIITGSTEYTQTLSDLNENTEYEFAARGDASDGDSDIGSVITFNTSPSVDITTDSVNVSGNQATFSGTLNDLGGANEAFVYFQYRQTGTTSWDRTSSTKITSPASYTQTADSLNGGTDYEVRARVNTTDGDSGNGSILNFTSGSGLKVNTGSIDDVDTNTILASGSIDNFGGASEVDVFYQTRTYYFTEYGERVPTAWTDSSRVTLNSTGTFSINISGLNASTFYDVRAKGLASDGDAAEASIISTTTDPFLNVETVEIDYIGSSSITLTGDLRNLGAAASTDVFFEYRQVGESSWNSTASDIQNSTGEYSRTITGLTTNVEYEVRAAVNASDGDNDSGSILTVTPRPVGLITEDATNITNDNATLRADLTDLGGAESASVTFQYRKQGNSTWNNSSTQNVETSGIVTKTVENLEVETIYEFRAIANTSDGDSATSSIKTFNTRLVNTQSASEIDTTSATLNSIVHSLGGAASADIYFEYRTTGSSSWQSTPQETITSSGNFSQTISGLILNRDYEFRVQFATSDGDSVVGNIVQFTTDTLLSVSTDSTGNVGDSFAVLNGTVNDFGGANSVEAYFEYRETGSSTWNTSSTKETLNSTGSYTVTIDGINPTTEYEARARVDASDGDTDTGSTVTFITDIELVVTTDQIDNIFQDAAVVSGTLNDLGEANDADVYFEYRRTGWNISRASFNTSKNVGNKEQSPSGVTFKNDGSKLFVVGFQNDSVYEYNLSSNWDITTATFNQSFSVLSEDGSPRDIVIGSNGSKMYILGEQNQSILEYDLSIPWDVSSASFNQEADISSEETNPRGIFFKNDGQRLYLTGISGIVNEYDLADTWDISTASFFRTFDVNNQDNAPTDVHFRDDGSRMYIIGDSNDSIYEYELSTPWNVTSATFDQSIDISSETTAPTGMVFKGDGLDLYISSGDNSSVLYYELPKNWSSTSQQNLTNVGSYQTTAMGLESDTQYDIRARADASDGDISFGSEIRFKTEIAIQVETNDATNVDEDKATLNATLNDLGEAANADVFFEYKQSTNENWLVTPSSNNVSSPTSYSQNIVGLNPDTAYNFRARVEASDGDVGFGGTKTFVMNETFAVTTGSSTNVDNSTVEFEGELTNLGGASNSDVFFEYRETGASTWNSSSVQNLSSTGEFSETVTGLSAGVDYEYRAVGNASDGDVSNGSVQTFVGGTPPVVNTDPPTNVDVSSMTLNGTLDDLGGASSADVYFEYRYSTQDGFSDWVSTPSQTLNTAGSVTFTENISNLQVDTAYQIRTVAEASDGNVGRGASVNQTTDTVLEVNTVGITFIGVYSVTFEGELLDLGSASDADVSFEYRQQGTSNWNGTQTENVNSTGTFTRNVSGLSVDTIYEFRAKVDASDGDTDTGSIQTVDTFSVETNAVTDKDTNSLLLSGTLENMDGYSSIEVSFQYRQVGSSTWNKTTKEVLTAPGDFSREIFSLQAGTDYEYRAFADFPDSNTANGDTLTETTHEFLTVTTDEATDIDSEEITLNGTLTELGGAASANVFFDFRKSGSAVWNSREKTNKSSTGSFSDQVTGLSPSTDYEVRARAQASDGDTAIGSVSTVSILSDISITTDSVSNIDTDAAEFSGTLGFLGGADSAEVYFQYRKTGTNNWNQTSRDTLSSTGSFSFTANGLEPDTEYEFRSFMEASDGDTKAGSVLTFITDPLLSIDTELVTTLGDTSATLRSTVQNLGNASSAEVYFEYRKTGNSTWTTTPNQAIASTGPVNEDITGLDSNVEYEYRANIMASDGDTDQGDIVTFITNPDPQVITDNVTNIGGSTVTLNGTLERRGGALSIDAYFEYRKTGAATWNATSIQVLTTPGSYSLQVPGLDQQSDYEFRAVIDASDGASATGVSVTFTTGILPTLQTNSASNLRGGSFTANGEITDLGTATSVEAFFEYRETGASTWIESARQTVDSTGVFSTNISDLNTTTQYEYRAKIITEAGDVLTGSTVTVTTNDAVSVVTNSPDVSGDRATFNALVEDLGGASSGDVFFEYREAGTTAFTSTPLENVTVIGSYSREVTGLSPKTQYEYRALLETSDMDSDSGILVKFTTNPLIQLTTDGSENIDTTVATLLGTISNLGGAQSADVYFQYRQVGASSWNRSTGKTVSVTQPINENLSGLSPNSQYEFRIKADTSDGDSETGDILNFTTDELVSVKTGSVQSTTFQSATVDGTVESLGGASSGDLTFEYRESGTTMWNSTSAQSINSIGDYSAQIDNLNKSTDYEFRAVLDASDGDSDAGIIKSFTTDAESDVEVSTNSASNINVNDVTLNGTLNNTGQLSSVDVNFKYREVGSTTWNETSTQTLNSTGNFSQNLSGLDENTEYEYQAKVEGPVTGSTFVVQTLPLFLISTNQPSEVSSIYSILEGSLDEFNEVSSVDVNFEWRETGTNNWNDTDIQTLSSTGTFTEKVGGFPSLNLQREKTLGGTVRESEGLTFNFDGTKVFVADRTKNALVEFNLSSPYDVSTATFNEQTLNVNNPSGLTFNSDGTKLFVATEAGSIQELSLSSPYSLVNVTLSHNFGGESNNHEDIAFNSDGTKMFVPDRGSEEVYQYNLTTGFDLSTASFSGNSYSTTGETQAPSGIVFSSDGTRMILSGRFNTDELHQYDLSTGFDISTVNYTGTSFEPPQVSNNLEGVDANNDGSKIYIVGRNEQSIFQYSTGGSNYDISNLTYDNKSFDKSDPTTDPIDIGFGDNGNRLFVLDGENYRVYENSLNSSYDVSNINFTGNVYNLNNDLNGGTLQGVTFSNDGTKMFVLEEIGNNSDSDKLNQFTLSTPWDITTATFDRNRNVANKERNLRFADEGNKLYTSSFANNNKLVEYNVGTAYDINGGVNQTDQFFPNEGSSKGINFAAGGRRMFLLMGNGGVYEYELNTPYDTTTATYTGRNFNWNVQSNGKELLFGSDFTQMFLYDELGTLREYSITTLNGNTEYEYRAVGTANSLTKEANNVNFNTQGELSILTDTASNVGTFDATLNGVVKESGSSNQIDTNFEFRERGTTTFRRTPTNSNLEGDVSFNSYDLRLLFGPVFDFNPSEPGNIQAGQFDITGKKYIVFDRNTPETIFQYDLTVPYDLSTASFNNKSYDVSSLNNIGSNNVRHMEFAKDGKILYIGARGDPGNIHQLNLNDAYDITSVSSVKDTQFGGGGNKFSGEIDISEDGTKLFYILDTDSRDFSRNWEFFREDFSTPFEIDTTGGSTNFGRKSSASQSAFEFDDNGSTFYTAGSSNNKNGLQKYDLSTPYDINSGNIVKQSDTFVNAIFNNDKTKWFNPTRTYLTNLQSDTNYEFRFTGANDLKTDKGSFARFSTDQQPVVSTQSVSSVDHESAEFAGQVGSLGGLISADVSFEYKQIGSNTWNETQRVTVNSTVYFTESITNLPSDTEFIVRARIETQTVTYGEVLTFKTEKDLVIETDPATNVNLGSATFNGAMPILNVASSADLFFEYRESGNTTWQTTQTETVSTEGSYTKDVTGLDSDIEYEYRLVGTAGNVTKRGVTYTFYTENNWVESFETDLTAWTVNDPAFDIKTNRVYEGSQSAGVESNTSETIAGEKRISASQPDSVEWFWQETTNQSGSALHFINSDGNLEVALGTNNPQWDIFFENSQTNVLSRSNTYDRWIRYKVTFDWQNNNFSYEMEDLQDGTTASGTENLSYGKDIDRIGLGSKPGGTSASDNWWDKITISKGDPIFEVSTGSSSVTNTTATLNGSLDHFQLGGDATVYFEWRQVGDTTWNKTADQTLSNTGSFSDTLTINTDNEYEFRAVAEASGFTRTGDTSFFSLNIIGTTPDALWTMDNDRISNDVLTERISGYNLHQVSNVTTGVSGQLNEAFSFDGSNSNYLPIEGLVFDTNNQIDEITLATWVKLENNENGGVVLGYDASEYFRFELTSTSIDPNPTAFNYSVDFPNAIDDGNWHHVVWVFSVNGSGWDNRIYLDGEKIDESLQNNNNAFGSGTTRYGFFGDDSEATQFDGNRNTIGFEGDLDESRYYSSAITTSEVQEIYGGELQTFTTQTKEATNINDTSATLNSFVGLSGADSADVQFEYRIQGSSTWNTTTSDTLTNSTDYSKSISGLTTDEIYEFRITGTDNLGNSDTGDIKTFTASLPFTEDFETDLSQWTVNDSNFSTTTSPVYAGSQSAGMENNVTQTLLIERNLSFSNPAGAEWYWWETGSQTGSAFHFFNSNGDRELAMGSQNPQWTVWDGTGSNDQIYNGDGTQRWILFRVTSFDFNAGTYDYYMEDLQTGSTRSGTRDLIHGVDIDRIALGEKPGSTNSHHQYWDNITVNN